MSLVSDPMSVSVFSFVSAFPSFYVNVSLLVSVSGCLFPFVSGSASVFVSVFVSVFIGKACELLC